MKAAMFQTLSLIVGGAVCAGLAVAGMTSPVWFWCVGIYTGYAIIWSGVCAR
jgi:hypothetical protein